MSATTGAALPSDFARFRQRVVAVTVARWWQPGDHHAVGYFRRPEPEYASQVVHRACGRVWHDHGWIDTPGEGYTVCPGDWVVRTTGGQHISARPAAFDAIDTPYTPDIPPEPAQDTDLTAYLEGLPEECLIEASGTYVDGRGTFTECWAMPVPTWITGESSGSRLWSVLVWGTPIGDPESLTTSVLITRARVLLPAGQDHLAA